MATFKQQLKAAAIARLSENKRQEALHAAKLKALKKNVPIKANEVSEKLESLAATNQAAKNKLDQLRQSLFEENSPQKLIENWDAKIPVLLMPLRVETTFVNTGMGQQELWVRIYPDDIAVYQHEPLLSEKEFAEGKNYWNQLFDAFKMTSGAEDAKTTAWTNLKNLFGANRAVWIAKQTVPTNWNDKTNLVNKEALSFPVISLLKNTEWTQAPRTKLLPDKFLFSLFKNGAKVFEQAGNLVPDTLMLGHDPLQGGEAFKKTDAGITFAKEFLWMADFEEAIKVGMGLKIPLQNDFFVNPSKQRIEQLVVMGVFITATPEASASMLGDLLENHRYTEGLAIIPQGTPTNNTESAAAGFIPNEDPQTAGFFDVENKPAFQNNLECDGNRLATTLAVNATVIQGIRNDSILDHQEAVTMNRALFPATAGYYFDTLLDRYVPDKYIPLLRNFFENHVTGAGPLPAIRIGDQPYGMLVTSDFTKWQTTVTDPDLLTMHNQIHQVLQFFSTEWELQSKQLPYVGREFDITGRQLSAEEIFLDVVGLEASSVKFERKTGFLNDLPQIKSASTDLTAFKNEAANNERLVQGQMSAFGAVPRAEISYQLFDSILYNPNFKVSIPEKNLIDGLPFSEERKLQFIEQIDNNYLAWLAGAETVEALEKQDFAGAKAPNFLLYLLARHALLLELRRVAMQVFIKRNLKVSYSAFDKTFLNLIGTTAASRDLTIWEILYADTNQLENGIPGIVKSPLGDQLLKKDEQIKQIKKQFGLLSGLPTARLERLLTGHLDCLNYRLDAWQTGLFYEKLERNRNDVTAPAKGIYIGAFGYLENLEPAVKTMMENVVLPKPLQSPDGNPVFTTTDSAGLLQAPSLDHAAAAALLMAGYRNHATPTEPGAFAVNLSSSRVRKATQVLEGIRNGQSLEALLGYQFERALHDNNLNQYILSFRIKYPIENQYNQQEGEAVDQNVFRAVQPNVVNGLKLIRETTTRFADIIHATDPNANVNQVFDQISAEVNKLADTLDAIKDLLLSESVFQAASGNTARTAAVLESLREGSLPPEPGILNTPRRNRFAFNHIVSLHFPQVTATVSPWGAAIPMSPRSQFEPGLNDWLAKIFGNPVNIICWVNHKNESTGVMTAAKKITLADLKIQPVDFLLFAGKGMGNGQSPLERRIATLYRSLLNLPSSQQVNIDLSKKMTGARRSFTSVLLLVKTLHAVLTQSRPVHAADYMPFIPGGQNGVTNKQGYDIDELAGRIHVCIESLQQKLQELDSIAPNQAPVNSSNPKDLDALYKQWQEQNFSDSRFVGMQLSADAVSKIIQSRIGLADFDLPNAWPLNLPGPSSESVVTFFADTAALWRSSHILLDNANAVLEKITVDVSMEDKVSLLTKLAKLLLGGDFPAMPKFQYQNQNDIKSAVRDRKQLLKYYSELSGLPDTLIPEDWLQSVSAVRTKINQWELARSIAETTGVADLGLNAIQLPYRKKDSWLAVQFPAKDEAGNPFGIGTDTISCAIFGAAALQTTALQSGLLIDEWSESIPVDTETTGVAFNYNQPDSMPPQALLLAVYPGAEKNWNWEALQGTVLDTFKRAKMRAVEPKHLQQNQLMAHFLPGIVAPVNTMGNNISLDFAIASDEFLKKIPAGLKLYQAHLSAAINPSNT